SVEIKLGEFV
ncbi:unnamed protein product, partial [Onchocerca ochengi]